MPKKPSVGFDFVVEWFGKAMKTTEKRGMRESALLWKDGLDHLLYLKAENQRLLTKADKDLADCEFLRMKIVELEESRDHWKREWRLLNAGLNMAEERIKELISERDADRRREYGYSQETVDALTAERGKLEEENKRLGEALDRIESMATIENTEIQKIAREALKEDSHE